MMKKISIVSIALLLAISSVILSCAAPEQPSATPGLEKELAAAKAQIANLEKEIASLKAPAPPAKQVILKYGSKHGPLHIASLAAERYAPGLEKATSGCVKLEVYTGDKLGDMGQGAWDAVQRGVADVGLAAVVYQQSTIPLFEIEGLPVWRDITGQIDAWDHGLAELADKEYAKRGWDNIKSLGGYSAGSVYIGSVNKKIIVPSDIKGLKVRINGAFNEALVNSLGGIPNFLSTGQAYEGLQRGLSEVHIGVLSHFTDWKLYEVCDYITDAPFMGTVMVNVIYNKSSLNKVPEDLRPVVIEFLEEMQLALRCAYLQNLQTGLAVVTKDMELISLTPEQKNLWLEASEPLMAPWLEKTGAVGQQALDILSKYNK